MTDDGKPGSGDLRAGEELDEGPLAQLRQNYNPPPEPPLAAMWERIEQDRLKARDADGGLLTPGAVSISRRTGSSRS
jgi:hypothetical protein